MKNIFNKIKISDYTYLFILICIICGYIKNIVILFSICIIHEFGHIIFIKLFNYNIIKINLLPFGGYIQIDKKINTSINKDIVISLGGIFIQLILFLLIFLFKKYINIITYNLIFNYNLLLILFNLIPIIPLDGNNILNLILEKYFSYTLSYKLNIIISIIFIIIFILVNYMYNLNNYFICLFLICMIIYKIKVYKYYKNRFILERYLYNFNYKKIINNTKDINNLKKETYHYFKKNNKYISEKNYIKNNIYN